MPFFEIRQYTVKPGKMDLWVELMNTEIKPFQVQHGMVICGNFRGETDDSVYFWIRRFDSEEQREAQYQAVYQSDHWKKNLAERVGELIDRESIVVNRVVATEGSVLQ